MHDNRIREIRKKKGISLSTLSKVTGISKSYLSYLERGKNRNPSINIAKKIADALEVSIGNLYPE